VIDDPSIIDECPNRVDVGVRIGGQGNLKPGQVIAPDDNGDPQKEVKPEIFMTINFPDVHFSPLERRYGVSRIVNTTAEIKASRIYNHILIKDYAERHR